MSKLIMTKGLPGCGKTTWAKEYQKQNPNTVRVNKDDLRAMLHNSVHSKGRESFVLWVRNQIVEKSLKEGHDVIVDDTNLNPIHEADLSNLAALHGFNCVFEVKDFTNIPLEECIRRDQKRPNYVGEKVIRQMYNQYLKPKPSKIKYNPELPDAIICDLDGTLALFGEKNPYDRDFENDELNQTVKDILEMYELGNYKILFVSGRDGKFREVTESWLNKHFPFYKTSDQFKLFMRVADDNRKDSIIKSEIYEGEIKSKYNIKLVLDDRNQVIEFWRSQGLTVFQVAEGDF